MHCFYLIPDSFKKVMRKRVGRKSNNISSVLSGVRVLLSVSGKWPLQVVQEPLLVS